MHALSTRLLYIALPAIGAVFSGPSISNLFVETGSNELRLRDSKQDVRFVDSSETQRVTRLANLPDAESQDLASVASPKPFVLRFPDDAAQPTKSEVVREESHATIDRLPTMTSDSTPIVLSSTIMESAWKAESFSKSLPRFLKFNGTKESHTDVPAGSVTEFETDAVSVESQITRLVDVTSGLPAQTIESDLGPSIIRFNDITEQPRHPFSQPIGESSGEVSQVPYDPWKLDRRRQAKAQVPAIPTVTIGETLEAEPADAAPEVPRYEPVPMEASHSGIPSVLVKRERRPLQTPEIAPETEVADAPVTNSVSSSRLDQSPSATPDLFDAESEIGDAVADVKSEDVAREDAGHYHENTEIATNSSNSKQESAEQAREVPPITPIGLDNPDGDDEWTPVNLRTVQLNAQAAAPASRSATQASRQDKILAQEALRLGFEAAQRRAFFSAQARFIETFRIIARSLDDQSDATEHSQSLRSALKAFHEAADFFPKASRPDQDVNLSMIISGHDTPILLLAEPSNLTPRQCLREYMAYAEQEFARALGNETLAAQAAYGLGRLQTLGDPAIKDSPHVRSHRSLMLYQTALAIDPNNFAAANELGVLLARFGQFDAAISALQHSVKKSPQSTAWKNLAAVHQKVGQLEHARLAMQQATRYENNSPASPVMVAERPQIEWVDPGTFAGVSPGPAAMTAPNRSAVPRRSMATPATTVAPDRQAAGKMKPWFWRN